eukprot:7382101-Prymnesium_polylepis.2
MTCAAAAGSAHPCSRRGARPPSSSPRLARPHVGARPGSAWFGRLDSPALTKSQGPYRYSASFDFIV